MKIYDSWGFLSNVLIYELIHVVNMSLNLSLNEDHQMLKYLL